MHVLVDARRRLRADGNLHVHFADDDIAIVKERGSLMELELDMWTAFCGLVKKRDLVRSKEEQVRLEINKVVNPDVLLQEPAWAELDARFASPTARATFFDARDRMLTLWDVTAEVSPGGYARKVAGDVFASARFALCCSVFTYFVRISRRHLHIFVMYGLSPGRLV